MTGMTFTLPSVYPHQLIACFQNIGILPLHTNYWNWFHCRWSWV